jgi:hypothetical protein
MAYLSKLFALEGGGGLQTGQIKSHCPCGPRALSRPGGLLVLTARADQLHRMPLNCAVAANRHVLNMAKQ